jgi:M6 family metalloprotease-like protein
VWAVPAKPGIITLKQPDGSVLKVRLRGDENYHYYETLDGERIESTVDGRRSIVNTQQNVAGESYNSKKRIHPAIKNPHFSLSASQSSSYVSHSQRAPHQAERGLVILVEFADVSFVKTKQNFDDLLHKEGYNYNGATGSARDYFRDASNGKYVPRFDLYGPYKLPQTMEYYGQNDYQGLDLHPDQMVVDAVAMLVADATANVNIADYDTDNDGNIDNIFIYYAGYGENEGAHENTIWPHAWEVYQSNVTGQLVYSGKCIKGYACTSELQGSSGSTICGIGTFCHEFSHVLGLPDYYLTTTEPVTHQRLTPGAWSLMGYGNYLNNGNTPPNYSIYDKYYLGWVTPTVLAESQSLTLYADGETGYMLTRNEKHVDEGAYRTDTVYYLENRQLEGWDTYLPGHGMLIWQVIFDEKDWYNNCPNDYTPRYRLISALSTSSPYTTTKPKPEVPFPGSKNITQYTPFAHNGLYNIQETNGIITFDFTTTTVQSGVEDITIDPTGIWYDLLGNVIDPTTYKGIVIHNNQKYILR